MTAERSAAEHATPLRTPALHVVVAAPPAVLVPDDLARLAGPADLIELRLDLLLPLDAAPLATWIAQSPVPVLATVRHQNEGGAFDGTAEEAASLLDAAWAAGAAYVDVEQAVAALLGDAVPPQARIHSVHGPDAQAPDGADGRVKIARPVEDATAWHALRELAGALTEARFVVPYGRLGAARGACFDPAQGHLLYGSADDASAVVPGQPALRILLDELRAGEVSRDARLYALVGTPPTRSPSPAMHNAVFRHRGTDALYVPLPGTSLDEALALPLHGMSVTHPYKLAAHAAADTLDDVARASGSVNTLVRRDDDTWMGFDTDAEAIAAAVRPASEGASAIVYGAGGYARSAVHALQRKGYEVRVVARTPTRAEAIGVDVVGSHVERRPTDRVVFNATPAGADGAPLPAFEAMSLEGLHVLDAPYGPVGVTTGLLAQALRQRARATTDGRSLLLGQAVAQALRFAGAEAVAEEALERLALEQVMGLALAPPATLYLLGTRGAGKSTVGRAVAQLLGRPFVDLDAEVRRRTGRSPRRWIEDEGWTAFRTAEFEALERVRHRHGIVVALGGGVVEDERSATLLDGDGVKVLLDVDAETAAARCAADAGARPRIPGFDDAEAEARALIGRRSEAWRRLADHVVDARGDVVSTAHAVAGCWHQHRP